MNKKILRFFAMLSSFLVIGCASSQNFIGYKSRVLEKNWSAAYETLESILEKNPTNENIDYAKSELENNKDLMNYADYIFSEEYLQFWQDRAQDLSIPRKRLDFYCSVSEINKCRHKAELIDRVEKSFKQKLYALDADYEKLDSNQKQSLNFLYSVRLIKSEKIGFIVDKQVEDNSVAATTSGAMLGSALASSAYIDKSIKSRSFNYSSKKHLAAEIAGAALGSSFDIEETRRYRVRYTIKSIKGDFIYYDEISGSSIGHSIGVCFDADRNVVINTSFCESKSLGDLINLRKL